MKTSNTNIVRRQVDLDFDAVPAGPWFPIGGPLEVMFNAASLAFPAAERFFIAAVRDCLSRITDPMLKEQVQAFIYQEGMHNKVHIDCNAMLARHYPHCHRAEKVTIVTFRWLGRLPRWFRLSLSSALEHFTSIAADTLLQYAEDFQQIVPSPVAAMWLWHAAEETEHKSVCFDVHRAVMGTGLLAYLSRVAGMLMATPIFLFVMLLLGSIVLGWGRPRQNDKLAELSRSTDVTRFVGRSMLALLWEMVSWRLYLSYYRPSFHPWDHDNSHFIGEWRQRYPSFARPVGNADAR